MGCGSAQDKSQKDQTKQESQQKAEMVIDDASENKSEFAKLIAGFQQGKDVRQDIPKISDKIKQSSKDMNQLLTKEFTIHLSLTSLTQIQQKLHSKAEEAQESLKQEPYDISPSNKEKQKQRTMIRQRYQEQAEEQKTREDKIIQGILLLQERIKNYKILQKEMKDDGNCQFRAISQGIFGTQDYHELLRAIAVWKLRKDKDYYSLWFQDGETGFNNFCNEMSENSTWGTELTLKALVDSLGITLHIMQSTKENYYLIYRPDEIEGPYCEHHVFVTYIEPIHYNAIIENNVSS